MYGYGVNKAMDGWMSRQISDWNKCASVSEAADVWVGGWINGSVDKGMDGWMDKWLNV